MSKPGDRPGERPGERKVVYSSETGRGGRRVEAPKKGKGSAPAAKPRRADGKVVVRLEKKGRKGHGATLIEGLVSGTDLQSLAKELKAACGSGGGVKDGAVEIQGDHRDRVVELLASRGVQARRGN